MSAGESCTSVPILYMHELSNQTTPFAAEIRYFNIDKGRALLTELLYNYNLYKFQADKD